MEKARKGEESPKCYGARERNKIVEGFWFMIFFVHFMVSMPFAQGASWRSSPRKLPRDVLRLPGRLEGGLM